jgi:hypothetical protein
LHLGLNYALVAFWALLNIVSTQVVYGSGYYFLPLLQRFNPAEPVVEKSVIL